MVCIESAICCLTLCQLTGGVCPDFTAMFVAVIDQTVDDYNILISDPEQTFKEWGSEMMTFSMLLTMLSNSLKKPSLLTLHQISNMSQNA